MQRLSEPAPTLLHPVRQHGAYGVVFDKSGRILVVRTETGRCYLPGGRMEAGEGPREALARELAEECGWSAEVGGSICRHLQPIFGGRVSLEASYWRVRLSGPLATAPEHEMLWLLPSEAAARLHRESDRAALAAALG
jgi:8-oxo-dGTP diphosphatase